jgi:spermidine/putrescine transport system permease protein
MWRLSTTPGSRRSPGRNHHVVTATAAPIAPEEQAPGRGRRTDLIGLGALLLAGALLVVVGARLVTGPLAVLLVAIIGASIVGLIIVAIAGGPEIRRRLAPYGLLKPGLLFLALFYLAPVFTLLKTSMSTLPSRFAVVPEFSWTLENYREAFSRFGPQFERGFLYAGIATVLCVLLGYPLAYVIAFRGGRWRNLLLGLVVVPFFTSYLIRTIAWSSLLADEGPIVGVLDRLGLVTVMEWLGLMDNGRLLNTATAVVGGLTYNFLPFMILPIYVSLEKIDPALRRVVLPLSLPGVFAGTLLTFIPAAGDFVNAQYLGGPNNTMIGNSIQDQFLRQNNTPLAAAMSFVLMAIITVGVVVYTKFFGTEEIT